MDFVTQKLTGINITEAELLTIDGESIRAANAVCSLTESDLDAGVGRVDTKSVSLTDAEMNAVFEIIGGAVERQESGDVRAALTEKAIAAGLVPTEG